MSANPARGEAMVRVGGADLVLRPSFAALVAAEQELGPLFALVERAASGALGIGELVALFWHCLAARPDGLTREWNGRFTGKLDRLCHDSRPTASEPDRIRGSKVLKAALALSVALEDDDEITPDEVRGNRSTIEQARDALDELLRKIVRAA